MSTGLRARRLPQGLLEALCYVPSLAKPFRFEQLLRLLREPMLPIWMLPILAIQAPSRRRLKQPPAGVRHRLLPKANGIALPIRGTPRRSSSDWVFVRWLAIREFPLELAGQRQWGGPLVASENLQFDQM
jgi:hypothetical protein